MGTITALVPESRRLLSDFKCPAPGADEADLLVELGRLAMLDVTCEARDLSRPGVVVLFAGCLKENATLTMTRQKYCFPPTVMLTWLNAMLDDLQARRRLVACRDGEPWAPGKDGEAVVFVDEVEADRLRAAGVVLAPFGRPVAARKRELFVEDDPEASVVRTTAGDRGHPR
jgi:hypothetical protein